MVKMETPDDGIGGRLKSQYQMIEWRKFRETLLSHYGHECGICGRTAFEGVVLQIHHRVYYKDRLPWQYALNEVQVICRGCHAEIHGRIPPRSGWIFLGDCDHGSPCLNCEYCDKDIRYVFTIEHPKWGIMDVGEQCCDNLTCADYTSASMRKYKGSQRRRSKFCGEVGWFRQGVGINKTVGDIRVQIENMEAGYRLWLSSSRVSPVKGRQVFSSERQAKEFIFDLIESGEADQFLSVRLQRA